MQYEPSRLHGRHLGSRRKLQTDTLQNPGLQHPTPPYVEGAEVSGGALLERSALCAKSRQDFWKTQKAWKRPASRCIHWAIRVGSYQLIKRCLPAAMTKNRRLGTWIRGGSLAKVAGSSRLTVPQTQRPKGQSQIRTPLIALAQGADDVRPFVFSYIIAIIRKT